MPKTLKDDLEAVDKLDIDNIYITLGLKCNVSKEFLRIALANTLLFDRKQQDYGPTSIAKFGIPGVIIRSSDKFERIATLFKANRKKPANEKLEDTYRDIAVYQQIILTIIQGKWPGL